MKQISIIVPIYNVKQYLKACFESLLKQDFKDYQIVAVNDGSPYGEQEIIDEYVNKYSDTITCINKENGGYGSALQIALNTIDTPYFIVCDPDDTLTDDCLSVLYKLISDNDCDIAIGCKNYVYNNSDQKDYHCVYNKDYVTINDLQVASKGSSEMDKFYFIDPSPHAKLYKTANAKDCIFPTKVSYTDNLLYYYNLAKADRVIYTSKALSNYLIDRPGNSMTSINAKAITSQQLVFDTIYKQIKQAGYNNAMLDYRLFESYMWLFYQIKTVNSDDKLQLALNLEQSFKLLSSDANNIYSKYKQYSKSSFKEKLRDYCIIHHKFNVYNKFAKKVYGK